MYSSSAWRVTITILCTCTCDGVGCGKRWGGGIIVFATEFLRYMLKIYWQNDNTCIVTFPRCRSLKSFNRNKFPFSVLCSACDFAGAASRLPPQCGSKKYAVDFKRICQYKKLSYRRETVRCVVSVEILPTAMQQCRNYLYDRSWKQEAQLSPSDCAMRLVSSNLANCHATVQKLHTTSPDQTDGMEV